MTPSAQKWPRGGAVDGGAREELREVIRSCGFDEVRFARVSCADGASLRAWLDAGRQADMHWMDRSADKRMDPRLVLPEVRTLILLGVSYWDEAWGKPWIRDAPAGCGESTEAGPRERVPVWARYAQHEDYHDSIKHGLQRVGRLLEERWGLAPTDYRHYVDTGPVLERGWAARAGVGFLGKNGMLISRRHGNWLLLAAILTRLEIAPDPPLSSRFAVEKGEEPPGLLCGKCTRCIDSCPTRAIPAAGVVDARRCISYHTIENRGTIPVELREGIGTRVFGCDVCLEVCPWNRFARSGRRMLLVGRRAAARLTLEELLAMTPEMFAELFRRTAVKRLKFTGLLRNACVAAGNADAGRGMGSPLLPRLVELSRHPAALVRAHAVWAVRRIAGDSPAAALLQEARADETDPEVQREYPCGP